MAVNSTVSHPMGQKRMPLPRCVQRKNCKSSSGDENSCRSCPLETDEKQNNERAKIGFKPMAISALLLASMFCLMQLGGSCFRLRRPEAHRDVIIAPISSRIPLSPMRDDELIDVVYVYANKTSPSFQEAYQNLRSSTEPAELGFLRSPPSEKPSIDMDLMSFSVKIMSKMATNLGAIYIVVNFAEEISPELLQIPGVQVVLTSQLYEGAYFSSNTVEAVIHRIPNLRNFYIEMNDDVMLTKNVDLRSYFFSPNGSPRTMYGFDKAVESVLHLTNRLMRRHKGGGGGKRVQVEYTVRRLSNNTEVGPNVRQIKGIYPSHAPIPFNREFVAHLESIDPDLFRSPFSTRFRCQNCLSVHVVSVLHSFEGGSLRKAKNAAIVAYVDSPSTWKQVVEQWDDLACVTLQEVEPSMQAIVSAYLEEKSRR